MSRQKLPRRDPRVAAYLSAIDALRECAYSIESEDVSTIDKLMTADPDERREAHAEAAAHRELADRLELEAIKYIQKLRGAKTTNAKTTTTKRRQRSRRGVD